MSPSKNGDAIIGNRTKLKVVKNKVAPPFKTAECDIFYGKGISYYGGLLNMGVMHEIINKSGAWFSYGDIRLGQGKDNARQYLEDNPELAEEIKAKVFEKLGRPMPKASGGDAEE